MNKIIRLAAVQMEHIAGDKDANFEKISRFVKEAAKSNVDIIAFPECCITGYWFLRKLSKDEITELAEPIPDGPSVKVLMNFAKEYNITVGAGFIENAKDGRLYNAYVAAMPDGTIRVHRKLHCFISEFMDSGSEYTVFDTPCGCKVGILTCYDNNIVENVRITALKGAQVLLAPHQTGGCNSPDPNTMGLVDRVLWDDRKNSPKALEKEFYGPKGRGWLMRWLPGRAHDNGMYLVFSNGVGMDDNEIRTGNAMILDTYGRIMNETWKGDDDMVIADADLSAIECSTGRRWIKTRRPKMYESIAQPTGYEEDTRKVRFDKKGI